MKPDKGSRPERGAPDRNRDKLSKEDVANRPRSDEEVLQRAAEPIEKEGKRPDRATEADRAAGFAFEEDNEITRANRAISRGGDRDV